MEWVTHRQRQRQCITTGGRAEGELGAVALFWRPRTIVTVEPEERLPLLWRSLQSGEDLTKSLCTLTSLLDALDKHIEQR